MKQKGRSAANVAMSNPFTIHAPKRNVPRKGMVGLTLPPSALALIDSLAGTFLGRTRSEILRFAILSWITEHHTYIKNIGKR